MANFNYTRYADDLRKAADLYDKDVAETYRKSAEIIEELWKMYLSSETDATNLTGELVTVCAELDHLRRGLVPECGECRWKGSRHQKCSCCRRNRYLKDCYEEVSNGHS